MQVVLEYGQFDPHKLANPEVKGKEYQEGRMKGFANAREYVLQQDRYVCQSHQTNLLKFMPSLHLKKSLELLEDVQSSVDLPELKQRVEAFKKTEQDLKAVLAEIKKLNFPDMNTKIATFEKTQQKLTEALQAMDGIKQINLTYFNNRLEALKKAEQESKAILEELKTLEEKGEKGLKKLLREVILYWLFGLNLHLQVSVQHLEEGTTWLAQ